jgi:hypothetical protein
MDNSKREILNLLGSFKDKYPSSISPHFANNANVKNDDGFADIILPGTETEFPEINKVSTFSDIKKSVAGSGSEKASFKRISEAAWEYSETGFEDVYIPGGANIWRYMSDEQLRCYFSRREDFRKGIFNTKYPTYIYIYIAEILFRENAPENLAFILAGTAYKYPNMKSDLCRFIKDYYIVNEIEVPFSDYIKGIGAENFFPSYMNPPAEDFYAKLFSAGDYELSKSRFLSEHFEIRRDFPKIFNAVIDNLDPLFSLFDINLESLIRADGGETEYYYPFTGVLYAGEFLRKDTATLTEAETYVRRGTWFMRSVSHTPSYTRKFAGFIKRQIDAAFRNIADYKYPLTDNSKTLAESMEALGGSRFAERLAKIISSLYLREIISDTCEIYLTGDEPLYSKTSVILHEKLKSEPLLSYRKIQKSETNPLRSLGIDEYSEYLSWKNSRDSYENFDYIKVYVNEIMFDKYLKPSEDFEQLALVAAKINTTAAKKFMRRSLNDYFITKRDSFAVSFPELIEKYGITELFPEVFIHSKDKLLRAESVIKLSGKSVKLPPELMPLYIAVVGRVYENVETALHERGINPDEVFFERHTLETLPEKKLFPFLLAFIVKFSEQIIKRELSFPGKINFENHAYFSVKFEEKCVYSVANYRLWRECKEYFLSETFPEMIESTVVKVLREDFPEIKTYPGKKTAKKAKQTLIVPEIPPEPIKVEVDFSKLDRVREEADEISKKLAAEEIAELPKAAVTAEKLPENSSAPTLAEKPSAPTLAEKQPYESSPEKPIIADNPFEDFYNALDGVYREVLTLILTGGDVNAFLREKNILPEVAAEHLNELALEFTGDIIIDDMTVIDEYFDDLKNVVKM